MNGATLSRNKSSPHALGDTTPSKTNEHSSVPRWWLRIISFAPDARAFDTTLAGAKQSIGRSESNRLAGLWQWSKCSTSRFSYKHKSDSKTGQVFLLRAKRVARLMALALRFDELLLSRQIASYSALASLGHVTRVHVCPIMNLLSQAPDIQEALLFLTRPPQGRDPLILADLQPLRSQWPYSCHLERAERMSRWSIRAASPKRQARTSDTVPCTRPLVLAWRFGLAGFRPHGFHTLLVPLSRKKAAWAVFSVRLHWLQLSLRVCSIRCSAFFGVRWLDTALDFWWPALHPNIQSGVEPPHSKKGFWNRL